MVILWYYNGIIIEGKAEEDGVFINARKTKSRTSVDP